MNAATSPQILIVEDDPKIASLLADYVTAEGFSVTVIADGALALRSITGAMPDAILLDVMLPGLDGVQLCREVRRQSTVPIMMLTARVDEVDRLLGLDTGADDYVCKPFSPREVMARLRALLRRSQGRLVATSTAFEIDDGGQRIRWRTLWLPLTPIEFRILRTLCAQPGRVFARGQLLDAARADFRDVSDRAIDSHIKNIRRKIAAVDAQADCIASIYGVGYRFDAPEA